MSVFAGNLGTSALAAHQIAIALWMITSYVCDGFADVGTMVGAKLLGSSKPDKFNQIIVLRNILMSFGLIIGFVDSGIPNNHLWVHVYWGAWNHTSQGPTSYFEVIK